MFLSINGVCALLGITRGKVHKYMKLGQFPLPIQTDTKMVFWDREYVSTWEEPKKKPKVKVAKERKPVVPKYRDGDNTWSGRGIMAKWLKAHISNGRSIDEFKV
jgi:predicted DNA-binding transcriptional regulator AlpA